MKHLLSILILLGFMSLASANECGEGTRKANPNDPNSLCIPISSTDVCTYIKLSNKASNYSKDQCVGENLHWHSGGFCMHAYLESCNGVDLREQTPTQIQNQNILIVVAIVAAFIIYLLVSASVKKTKEAYKASTIPLKNKVKRKELETRLSELEDVTPAEQTYAKSSYEDETEEIREVKKLERQIKIKKLKKELKDLEAEEE